MSRGRRSTATLEAEQLYLNTYGINALFTTLVENLLIDKPTNPIRYIVEHLQRTFPDQVASKPTRYSFMSNEGEPDYSSDEKEEDNFEDDEVDDLPAAPASAAAVVRRVSVCAESVHNDGPEESSFKYPVYPKSDTDKEKIRDILRRNILFAHLDEQQRRVMVDAMFGKSFDAEEVIIRQGDDGDNFYILASGECDVYVSKGGQSPRRVMTCVSGDSFGELALMYNSPRAATVVACGTVRCWAVDRMTFKKILMDTTIKKRNLYLGFLSNVGLLSTLTEYERMTIADALVPVQYEAGHTILRQGDPGDTFYIIEDGEVLCTLVSALGSPETEVCRIFSGHYFGEIALLTDRPRQATVRAVTDVKLLTLDRKTFKRVMGPLQDILKRNMSAWNAYMAQKL